MSLLRDFQDIVAETNNCGRYFLVWNYPGSVANTMDSKRARIAPLSLMVPRFVDGYILMGCLLSMMFSVSRLF